MADRGAGRVALIASSYHPYPGGVEEHVRNVARELRRLGHAVEVWTVDRGERLGTRTLEGVVVRYLPTPLPRLSPGGLAGFLRASPRAWGHWLRAVRDFRPDVLHVHCFGPNGVYALGLRWLTRRPLVLSAHGETFMDPEVFRDSRVLRWALVRTLRSAAAVTGCSRMVLTDLRDRFGFRGEGTVVPNGVDLEEQGPAGAAPVEEVTGPTVLAVGRLVRVKGFDLLVRAFAAARVPDARLVIGGDGPERSTLDALVRDLGIAGRVEFPGRLDRAGVVAHMAAADVVVVPSRIEAFGIVVLEAWRAGAALLASSRGGPADLVTDGVDGLLVDPEDVDAFAAALALILSDPALRARLGAAGRVAVEEYTWERTARAYSQIYARIRGAAHE